MLGGKTSTLRVADRLLTLLVSIGMVFGTLIYAVPALPADAVTNISTFEVGVLEFPAPSTSLTEIINGDNDWDGLVPFTGDLDPGEVVVINDTNYTGPADIIQPATAGEVADRCPNINDDDIIAGGTKIDDSPFVVVSGSVPGKVDLCQVYVSYGFDASGDTILFVGALRREINGSVAVAIELNQISHAKRLADDLLVTFEFDGNGPISVINVRKWNGSTWGDPVSVPGTVGGSFEHFGEVKVNLTANNLLPDPTTADDCSSFSSVLPYGFRGNDAASQVGDWLDPVDVRIPRCGLLRIIKDSNPPSGSLEFGWRVADNSQAFPDVTGPIVDDQTVDLELVNGTYTLTEDVILAPYSFDRIECDGGFQPDAITVAVGTTVTCTIYNEASELVVGKRGQGDPTAAFAISVTGQTNFNLNLGDDSSVFSYAPGTSVDISETLPAGNPAWHAQGVECRDDSGNGSVVASSNDGSVSVDTVAADRILCLITNIQDGQITVVKKVVNNDGGTLGVTDFPLFLNGGSVNSGQTNYVPAGTYTASETSKTGYTETGPVCEDDGDGSSVAHPVDLAPGQAVTCTITNNDNPGTLTLLKDVVPQHGGSAADTAWTLAANGPTPISGSEGDSEVTNAEVDAGKYDLSETGGPFGWEQTGNWNCRGANMDDGDTVNVGLAESVTCEVTNTDIAPLLTLVKDLQNPHGGNATIADFLLHADGPVNIFGTSGQPAVTNAPVNSGSYDLSEEGPTGYVQVGDWVCLGGDQTDADTVKLGPGEEATCTITNRDQQPELIVIKDVENNHGGNAAAGEFQLYVNGVPVNQNSPVNGIVANTVYTVSEDLVDGYVQKGSAACVDNHTQQAVSHPVTLSEGQSVTCTITNEDIAPGLSVIKDVDNFHGGDAVDGDFQLYVNGSPKSQNVNLDVDSNVQYTVTEDLVDGYAQFGDVVCVDDDTQQAIAHPVTLAEGQSVTCTITNRDIAPELKLIKIVENNHGGNATAGDFQLRLNGDPMAQNIFLDADSNKLYTVTEDLIDGYVQKGSVACVDNDTRQAVSHPVTLAEGQSVTCTITNEDIAPELIVTKIVINDDGGNAVAGDFQLYVNASTATQNTVLDVLSNTEYSVTEDQLAGYFQVGDVVCVDNDTQQAVDHPVTLAEGQSVTCTITNDDFAPGLKVIKIVINDDGGNAQPSDFQLYVNGGPVDQDVALDVSANVEHTVTEDQLPGYTQVGDVSCVDNDTQEAVAHPVTLSEGQSVTCTITNDDDAPALILIKEVINDDGDTAEPADFQLRLNGSPADQGVVLEVDSNVEYTVTEDLVEGYLREGDVSCVDNSSQQSVAHPVTLGEGQSVTCTITNNDIPEEILPEEILPVEILPFTGVFAEDLFRLGAGLALLGLLMLMLSGARREQERLNS